MNRGHALGLAVWLVIASEAMLFAGLFALYAAYRSEYPVEFEQAARLDIAWMGGVNTLVLLTSSFAMAFGIHLVRSDRARGAQLWLGLVLGLGLVFLAIKLAEWGLHLRDGIAPGAAYAGPLHGRGAALFFTLYFLMTGLHAAHVVAGLVLVAWVFFGVRHRHQTAEHHVALELVGLYWHFVDVVWVFLWPMFYLLT